MGNVATVEQREIAAAPQASEAVSLLAVIERAARDPSVDIDKVERLMAMYERQSRAAAEQRFNEALSLAQADMAPVATDCDNKQTRSRYASYAALDRALRPIYTAHGFSLSFDSESPDRDTLRILCYVAHRAGHTRTYHLDMPADGKGAKGGDVMTRTHATGSASSYGMRYLLRMIFNVAVGEDDDDGQAASSQAPAPVITKAQLGRLLNVVSKCGPGAQERFNSDYPDPSQVQAAHYDAIINSLESAAIKYQAALSKRSSSSE